MNKFKKLGWVGFIFLVLFLLVSLPQAQSGEGTGNETVVVTSQEATIPLSEKEVSAADSPTLTFKLAGVALYRENNKSQTLMYSHVGGGNTTAKVSASDLNLGWAPGMDASLMLQNPCFGVELRYLGLAQWDESKSHTAFNLDFADEASVGGKFRSALHNAELNLHWWPCTNDRYSLLAGFRWFRLTDKLSGYEWGEGGPFYDYSQGSLVSRNDLYGGQFGVEGLLFGKRDQGFSLGGVVKGGVFANKIRNHEKGFAYGYNPFEGRYDYDYSDVGNRTKTAYLGEVIVNLNYAFTKNIGMCIGYQFLYVKNVAVPVNDHASTQSVMFQGGRMGLNIAF
jgi:hypothetical protein